MANGVMNKKELKKAFQTGLISQERFKEELFKLETINAVSKRKKKLPVSITEDEWMLLLQNTDKERFRVAFLFGYGSGMRLSEIVGGEREDGNTILPLTKEKIDLKGKSIRVEDAKGGKDRIVPLPKGFKEQFLKYLPFTQGYSNIESCRRSMEKAFKRAAAKAGLLKIKPSMHFHCVSDDTEILTKEGWKKVIEVNKGEKIFSYNLKKDLIEDDEIREINKFNYDGEMINIKNSYIDCLMSPEHKDLMNISHIKQVNKKRLSSVWDNWKLISMTEFLNMPNKRLIKKKVSGIYDGKESIGKEKAGLLGWILTDGCISFRKGERQHHKPEITIVQSYDSNKEKCEIIQELLLKSGVEHSIKVQKPNKTRYNPNGRMIVFRISSKANNLDWILKYLDPHKKPKFNLLNLKNEELQELYNMMMLGDGCNNREFTAQNKEIIEFLQILCILINRRCLISKGKHNITGKEKERTWITEHNEVNVLPSHISKINYKGIIWCPTTKNNTWILRRNNKVSITGNSLRHGFGTRMANQGVPIHQIRTLMGHSNISTTNIYLEANPQEALKSYEKLF